MPPPSTQIKLLAALVTIVSAVLSDNASAAQLMTKSAPTQPHSASAGGASFVQDMTPDARYVLFVSTANNLSSDTNSLPAPQFLTSFGNVYRRDRQLGITDLVSGNLSGRSGNGDSLGAVLSTNGALAVFESTANDLVNNDTNGLNDIFVRDLEANATFLISVSTNGGSGNGESRNATVTPDGRFVAFVSAASNLVPNDTNRIPDIFVRDLQAGTTVLASIGAAGNPVAFPPVYSTSPKITPDGRFVSFLSSATNLVPNLTNTHEIYVRDLQAGVTYWASTNARALRLANMGSAAGMSFNHSLSADGHYVGFETGLTSGSPRGLILRHHLQTGLTDLIHTNASSPLLSPRSGFPEDCRSLKMSPDGRFVTFVANTNGTSVIAATTTCVLRWDGQSGVNTLISEPLSGPILTNSICDLPTIDATGRYPFISTATNLVTNSVSGEFELYRRDTQLGITALISADTNDAGLGVNANSQARSSASGQVLAFDSAGANFTQNDLNRDSDVFVRSLTTNLVELISSIDSNRPSRSVGTRGFGFSLSADGHYLAFASETESLVSNDTNGLRDVFVRDLTTDAITLVSVRSDGLASANGASFEPAISGDGRYVAFTSWASNLVTGDTDKLRDVFVRDLWTGTTTNASALLGDFEFFRPQIDATGKFLLVQSTSPQGPHLINLQTPTNTNFSASSPGSVLTPDGQFVAYTSGNRAVLWNTASNKIVWASANLSALPIIGISGDGRRIAYGNATTLIVSDTTTSNSWTIANGVASSANSLRLNQDGRFLVFVTTNSLAAADNNNLADIYLYDFETAQTRLISCNPGGAANGVSDTPGINADGRFVIFRSAASNLTTDDSNTVPDVFLYDQTTGALSCLSKASDGVSTADNRSHFPVFSAFDRSIVFQSWAENLSPQDFDHANDLFVVNLITADITKTPASATIRWLTTPGTTYTVEFKDSLNAAGWQPLVTPVTITDQLAQTTDPNPNINQRWYRVVAQ